MALAESMAPDTGRHALRIVFAPDSFKGSIRAADAARAMAEGWLHARPSDEIVCLPMADGGEGTLEAFEASIPDARRIPLTVEGPMGHPVDASWLLLRPDETRPETGVVELATTSGIELVPTDARPRPLDADSVGFGEAIQDALRHGVSRLVLAVGGSASSDGGAGVLSALGARIVDARGLPIRRGARGLETTAVVDLSAMPPPPVDGAVVLADVTSPLLGPTGAAAVFAPQKGASPRQVRRIETALEVWARLVGADPRVPGAGAAGGVAYALMAWGARPARGAEAIADLIGLRRAIAGADLVVTGEGSFDIQSGAGKAPSTVLSYARQGGVSAAVIAGRVDRAPQGCRSISLTEIAGSASRAMSRPANWLREAAALLAKEVPGWGQVRRSGPRLG